MKYGGWIILILVSLAIYLVYSGLGDIIDRDRATMNALREVCEPTGESRENPRIHIQRPQRVEREHICPNSATVWTPDNEFPDSMSGLREDLVTPD